MAENTINLMGMGQDAVTLGLNTEENGPIANLGSQSLSFRPNFGAQLHLKSMQIPLVYRLFFFRVKTS